MSYPKPTIESDGIFSTALDRASRGLAVTVNIPITILKVALLLLMLGPVMPLFTAMDRIDRFESKWGQALAGVLFLGLLIGWWFYGMPKTLGWLFGLTPWGAR